MCMYVYAISSTVFTGERMNPVFCRERWASEEAQAFVSKTEDLAYAYWPPVASPLLLYNIVTSDFVQCLLSPQVDSQKISICVRMARTVPRRPRGRQQRMQRTASNRSSEQGADHDLWHKDTLAT